MITLLRPYLLMFLGLLASAGLIPPPLVVFIESHPLAVLGFTLLAWAWTAWRRNRKASTYAQETS